MSLVLKLSLLATVAACGPGSRDLHHDWPVYKADAASTSYSPLDQINRSNVKQLQVAWTFQSGDEELYTIECNPIVVNGVLYLTSPMVRVFALDAGTGHTLWRFDPYSHGVAGELPRWKHVNRGLVYWTDGAESRIFFTFDYHLYALNARNGSLIQSFGRQGMIDLRGGLDRESEELLVQATSPGVIFEDLLILGSTVGDGVEPTAPGHIRAYDVRTGEREWIFHTIPHPGESGHDTWPAGSWKTAGGVNAWGGLSLDGERGLVFIATGSPSYDHYGGERKGKNLFSDSVVALKAATGERVWHFQTVHHDLWDFDLPCPPSLVRVTHDGKQIDAVAQVTKMGHLFLLDRDTGRSLFPVEERPVPQSQLDGEESWPTQPFPLRPPAYARQGFDEGEITDLTPGATAFVHENYLKKYGPSRLFDPPGLEGSIAFPQFNGGTDWGGAAVDPESGLLYVNASNEPEMIVMRSAPEGASHAIRFLATGHLEVFDQEGFPISRRPWGTLNAIDLNRGEIVWQVPLGTYPELEKQGYPDTGTFNIGGPLVTGGGLVFIGATRDARFRAFDKETGDKLWEFQLEAGAYASPSTYMVDGRQFIVVAAGGGGKPGTPPGDLYVAFGLSEGR